jgi:hypothetical protein
MVNFRHHRPRNAKEVEVITEVDANQDFVKNVESEEQQKMIVKRTTLEFSQK